ncbi:G-protein coupled receptor 151 [Erpetoichthys calabaricus]|uniref:G-protein coupled receptor 151 n=1 Tax=Erpetoichthys calabaricus TaxID=27687 RepID=UPI0022341EF3|nr:G-protein coupled receptor 151 [Erpetoichthys calabaricus]
MDKFPIRNFSTANSSLSRQRYLSGGQQHLDSAELQVAIPVVLGAICVLGFVGNVTVVGVLMSNARKGKPSLINSLILNLSIADLLVLAFAVPVRAAAYSKDSWTLGWFVCKTCDWFVHSCMAAKSFTIAIVAKACFMYVSNPTKQVTIRTRTIVAVLFASWTLACVLPLPHWLFATLRDDGRGFICVQAIPRSADHFMSIYLKVYPCLIFCAPFSFAFVYFWRAYGRCQKRGTKTQNLRMQIRSRKLTVMLLCIGVAFAILWLPEWVTWVWINHAELDGPFPPLYLAISAQVLMFTVSSVNPFVVLSMSEEFRSGYKGLWRRLTVKKAKAEPPVMKDNNQEANRTEAPASSLPPPEQSPTPENPPPEPEPSCSQTTPDSPKSKDNVLPDVEQFWHERESGSANQENDPVPWEHQEAQ